MVLHLPHTEGVFGVTFNCATKDDVFNTTTSRFVSWMGAFSQARQELWLPKDDLRDSSSWSSPPLMLLRDIHSKFCDGDDTQTSLQSYTTAKRSVCRLRHRSTQELVLDRAPRMVSLSSRRLLLCPFRSSTVSLRLLLCGTRALSPLLVLPSSLHSLRSPSRSCFIDSPSGTLSLNL
jgi:hypothetical protein